jgi:lipopolysaccharide transport system ATP-binding protein
MRIQNGKAEILNVELLSESGKVSEIFDFNESITANIKIQSKESIEDLTYGIHIRDQYGVDVLYFDDSTTQMSLPLLNQNGVGQITLQTKLPLAEGDYVISILLSKLNPQGGIEIYDFIPLSYHFKMNKRQPRAIYGKVSLPTETRFQVLDV